MSQVGQDVRSREISFGGVGLPPRPPGGRSAGGPAPDDNNDFEFNMRIDGKVLLCRVTLGNWMLVKDDYEVCGWVTIDPTVGHAKIKAGLTDASFALSSEIKCEALQALGLPVVSDSIVLETPRGLSTFNFRQRVDHFFTSFAAQCKAETGSPVQSVTPERLAEEILNILDQTHGIRLARPAQLENIQNTIKNSLIFMQRERANGGHDKETPPWSERRSEELLRTLQGNLPLYNDPSRYVNLFQRLITFFEKSQDLCFPR